MTTPTLPEPSGGAPYQLLHCAGGTHDGKIFAVYPSGMRIHLGPGEFAALTGHFNYSGWRWVDVTDPDEQQRLVWEQYPLQAH